MIKPNWSNWFNGVDGIDPKPLKEIEQETKSILYDAKHLGYEDDDSSRREINSFASSLENYTSNYEDVCAEIQKEYKNLEAEYTDISDIAAELLDLLDAVAMDEREDRKFKEVVTWCNENFNGSWNHWLYARKEWIGHKRATKRYLIIAAFNENDRLFLKMRWS